MSANCSLPWAEAEGSLRPSDGRKAAFCSGRQKGQRIKTPPLQWMSLQNYTKCDMTGKIRHILETSSCVIFLLWSISHRKIGII